MRPPLVCRALVLLLVTAGGVSPAYAHPHAWIDLGMRLVFDDRGRLEALHQAWRLDPFSSLVILEELGQAPGGDGLDAGLDRLGAEMRDNLSGHGYFTELHHGEVEVALGEVEEYTVMARGERVEFVFLLPLEAPLSLEGETLRYRVFDPSYYLEVVHEAGDDGPSPEALRIGEMPGCETRILPADPDPERVAEAARLDVDDTAPEGLGRYFAETGEVRCG
jgi:ABC-type uncharacterized transport system substrate-binding protein